MLYSYILFPTHTSGLKLESVLKAEGINYTITPTPRELSSCCGISIRINPNLENKVRHLIESNKIPIASIEKLEIEKYFNI